ncbi:hypothetical protein [Acetivibrio cellulolyticus]|uniref:hypothetical protein n=1 Tax=Acetivibrio cellulolyticus TaxID=35830 RepID=UPI0001E2E7AE|nr:hypothetical protein [Acetivibrio cellulolyticus]
MKTSIKRIISTLTMITVFLLLFSPAFAQEDEPQVQETWDKTISGKVCLPKGIVASNDTYVSISVYTNMSENENYFENNVEVLLKENTSYAEYTLNVPSGKGYVVSFWCYGTLPKNILNYGYYNESGTVMNQLDSTKIDVMSCNAENINLNFIKGKSISGIVYLPEGIVTPSEGGYMNLFVNSNNNTDDNYDDDYYNSASIEVPVGVNSFPYSISVLEDRDYSMSFDINSIPGVLNRGYYNTNGTVLSNLDASLVNVKDQDIENVNIKLAKGVNIEGTLNLPDNMTAPEGGINVYVNTNSDNGTPDIWEDDYYSYTNCIIPQGENSVNYSLTVVPSKSTSYILNYTIDQNTVGLFNQGYYCKNGSTIDPSKATPVVVGAETVTDINIILAKGAVLKGTISIPEGMTVPTEGFYIDLNAQTDNMTPENYEDDASYYANSYIEGGSNSAKFYITVDPSKTDYVLNYGFWDTTYSTYKQGYYNSVETAANIQDATKISDFEKEIDFKILQGVKLCGKVSLPNGEKAPEGGLQISLNALSTDISTKDSTNGISAYGSIYIGEGENFAPYTLEVYPKEKTSCFVNYDYYTDQKTQYLNKGYYSQSGMGYSISNATPIIVDKDTDTVENINLTLLKGVELKGELKIPEKLVNKSDLCIYINAINENGTPDFIMDDLCSYTSINADGKSKVPFTLYVAPGLKNGYKLSFNLYGDLDEYVSTSYYNKKGMVGNYKDATPILVGNSGVKDIKLSAIKGVKISGVINIEEANRGEIAPSTFYVTATSDSNTTECFYDDIYSSKYFNVTEGQNSIAYEIYVVPESDYTLSFGQYDTSDYMTEGFYSKTGTVHTIQDADKIKIGKKAVKDINFNIDKCE